MERTADKIKQEILNLVKEYHDARTKETLPFAPGQKIPLWNSG